MTAAKATLNVPTAWLSPSVPPPLPTRLDMAPANQGGAQIAASWWPTRAATGSVSVLRTLVPKPCEETGRPTPDRVVVALGAAGVTDAARDGTCQPGGAQIAASWWSTCTATGSV